MQLLDALGNVNKAVSVVINLVFDSNDEKALLLPIETLNIFFDCSDEDECFVIVLKLFFSVR